jgi:hypothetical protein
MEDYCWSTSSKNLTESGKELESRKFWANSDGKKYIMDSISHKDHFSAKFCTKFLYLCRKSKKKKISNFPKIVLGNFKTFRVFWGIIHFLIRQKNIPGLRFRHNIRWILFCIKWCGGNGQNNIPGSRNRPKWFGKFGNIIDRQYDTVTMQRNVLIRQAFGW